MTNTETTPMTDRQPAETLGRCRTCSRTFDPYVRTDEGYIVHADGTIRTPGTPAGMVLMVGDQTDVCPSCGNVDPDHGYVRNYGARKWWTFTTLKAKFSASRCDTDCTTATGSECRCSCGGWAHGSRA